MSENKMTFEESMDRLEEIVRELERNEKPLDETIRLFEEGLTLSKTCNAQLKEFETKMNALLEDNQDTDGDQ